MSIIDPPLYYTQPITGISINENYEYTGVDYGYNSSDTSVTSVTSVVGNTIRISNDYGPVVGGDTNQIPGYLNYYYPTDLNYYPVDSNYNTYLFNKEEYSRILKEFVDNYWKHFNNNFVYTNPFLPPKFMQPLVSKPSISQKIWRKHFWPAIENGEKINYLHFKNQEIYLAFLADLPQDLISKIINVLSFQACDVWNTRVSFGLYQEGFGDNDYFIDTLDIDKNSKRKYYKSHE